MRTFVAIEIPQDVKKALRAEQDRLRELPALRDQRQVLRWTNPDNLHLTLRFLGETETGPRSRLQSGLADIAARHAPFRLALTHLGCFRSWSNLRVLWVGIRSEKEALQALQADVESVAQRAGFAPERNSFSPHITLARTVRNAPWPALRATSEQLRRYAEEDLFQSGTGWSVGELHFIRSVLSRGGAQYSNLATCALTNRA
ncbi:MAG: RNA 2',3'-cyclic phosphodiesterase [Caldilineaceae bacterium]|nr:RNA 2',3'-cyclic phosphodiesterase [Caldilineaceae bacterium]MDE0337376.1 RNA 2',3'-cyclic phosphodiesterase [Caldilineaceae bacterium]